MKSTWRRLRQRLLELGQTQRYLSYAVGEIVLVVIGILIALQINNWNEARKDRNTESVLISEIIQEREFNITAFTTSHLRNQDCARSCDLVENILKNQIAWNDSFAIHFRSALNISPPNLSSSAYQSLRDFGIGKLSSSQVQQNVIKLYDQYESTLNRMTRIVNIELKPATSTYIMKHFSSSRMPKGRIMIFPNSYDDLIKDVEYRNIISYVQQFRKGFFLNEELDGIEESKRVLKLLEQFYQIQ